ncbi:kif21a protein [Lichtheimia corymbifera JMRC:FSU:9682]|uniref:Kif21a protein n=1 Tax=Lichtheimia corymbifera JMRC:FSU:9682 TaxID=1263082 RepID=A0A068RIZ8_9FUNG|nr:kif21a protein [Lichtheimia corymbifera JMRC:FSU:9682]
MATTAVRVALRVRPLSSKERSDNAQQCVTFADNEPQIFLGHDRAFTFDSVFDPSVTQDHVFETCVAPLLCRFREGNNVTILAYGQTGSGKTYSMGTGALASHDQDGIIQRFAHSLFNELESTCSKQGDTYQVYVSFLELYHEDLNDLLEPNRIAAETHPSIREDVDGNIFWLGVREEQVHNADDMLMMVRKGVHHRATGSTDVNATSSRSHAIFSVLLKQQIANQESSATDSQPSTKRLASKFHFVDLAGSERLKRTIGDRQKEGISINTGLLALGNVISALGDESRKGAHVPYRDSKLTRLLQDSLGGNSHTLMLACVSPSDADYMKTLSTLKYAGRARNIQNRVEINHDYEGSPEELNFLRNKVSQLKMQISMLQKVTGDDQGRRLLYERDELARMHKFNQDVSAELAQVQSERDTLMAELSPNHVISEAHPVIREYAETVQDLKLELAEAHSRIANLEAAACISNNSSSAMSTSTITVAGGDGSGPSRALAGLEAFISNSTVVTSSTGHHHHQRDFIHKPIVTSSGRRRSKYVPIAQRIRTHHSSSKRATRNKYTSDWTPVDSTSTEEMEADKDLMTTNESAFDTEAFHKRLCKQFAISATGLERTTLASTAALNSAQQQHDNDENSMLDNNKPGADIRQDSFPLSDCHIQDDLDTDNELEALDVPTWTDDTPKAQSINNDSSKRESLSWTDSILDDSDNSIGTSRLSSSWTTVSRQQQGAIGSDGSSSTAGRRRSKDLLKMLHQVQADLLVKQELVGQLEKSEGEFSQMRSTYEDKLNELHEHLMETQKERDVALQRKRTTTANPATINRRAVTGNTATTAGRSSAANAMQLREAPRQVDEVRRQYEQKLKKLSSENHELKRKYTQTNHTLQSARSKAEAYVNKLQREIDALKLDKKQMLKAAKMEADKTREQNTQYERDIQTLKRRESTLADAKKKIEDQYDAQAQLLRRRNDEVASMATQLRQLNFSLRKAATEGIFLNEASLEKILSTITTQRASKSPTAMRRTSPDNH